tara:strand:- start:103 stop:288 length:186 start_codon:yes stop_codon:yes gene_type:complete
MTRLTSAVRELCLKRKLYANIENGSGYPVLHTFQINKKEFELCQMMLCVEANIYGWEGGDN